MRHLICIHLIFFIFSCSIFAQENISHFERYAFSQDRKSVLESLNPGTKDYYFLHILHAQQTKQLARAKELLGKWSQESKEIKDLKKIEMLTMRQVLLENNDGVWEFLKSHLGVSFYYSSGLKEKNKKYASKVVFEREALLRRLKELSSHKFF